MRRLTTITGRLPRAQKPKRDNPIHKAFMALRAGNTPTRRLLMQAIGKRHHGPKR